MPDLFIGGAWRDASDGGTRPIRCPADGKPVATVSEGTREDALDAVGAARRAFDHGPWRETTSTERAAVLNRVADMLEEEKDEVARLESLDTGKRFVESQMDVDDIVGVFRHYAGLATADAGRVVDAGMLHVSSRIVHEPVGVCSLITPWNYPLLQTSWKVAPALAAGNTFVLKPSELTPSTAIWLMRTLASAGVPDGVANLVLGSGTEVGVPLTDAPEVDLVSFTGGLETGRRIMAAAAPTVKKVALELGRKNPNIVFADADLDAALDFAHSPPCSSTRARSARRCAVGRGGVHQGRIRRRTGASARRIRLGTPFDDRAETGPLISAEHRDKVDAYVARGVEEGAVLRVGGAYPDDPALAEGFFYLPTILDHCTTDMSVVQEESFGPVLTVETFSGATYEEAEDAAVAIANDTIYGRPGPCGPRTPVAPSGSRGGCDTARSGSTTTIPTSPRPSGAE